MRKSAGMAQGCTTLPSLVFLVSFAIVLAFAATTAFAQSVATSQASAQRSEGPPAFTPPSNPNIDGVGPRGLRAGHILVRFKASPSQDVLNHLEAEFGAKVVSTIAGVGVTHL